MPTAFLRLSALGALSLALSGCVTSSQSISADYGRAVREDILAQIADPDARHTGDPAPASNGARTSLAQTRYERNAVIKPASTATTQKLSSGSNGGGGDSGGAQ